MKNPKPTLDKCGVCREAKPLGTCDFGQGNPYLLATIHCRACCERPDADNWRPLSAAEGTGPTLEFRVRRILRQYASAYARFLGRITLLGCARVIRQPKQAM